MTYLELVNKVLVRMREGTVTTVNEDENSALMGEFVQQATSEVEDVIDWIQLRTTINIVPTENNFNYTLTGAGSSFDILGVFEDIEDYYMEKAPSYNWMNARLLSNDQTPAPPRFYDINGQDVSGDPIINFWPIPDAGPYSINVNLKIKSVLADDADVTPIAWLPIVLRATMLAVEERGDDQGASLEVLGDAFVEALASAVAYDQGNYPDEVIWEVV